MSDTSESMALLMDLFTRKVYSENCHARGVIQRLFSKCLIHVYINMGANKYSRSFTCEDSRASAQRPIFYKFFYHYVLYFKVLFS